MTRKTALLIDANALIHRAWHALPPMTAPDGKIVNAVYGFSSVLMNILASEHPDYLAVCWDTEAPTFRHEAEPTYKATRVEQPQEFYDQFPIVKKAVEAFGGTNIELDGYEADDLLGTLATHFAKDGIDATILTSDRDVWQMIGPRIRVMAFKKGVSETTIYDEAALKEATGLTPSQIIDYKAMRGDASDNLKGIPGIGEKTATELLLKYHDLKGVLKAAHDARSDLSPSVRQKLVDGEASAIATLPLVTIVIDAPIPTDPAGYVRREADLDALKTFFMKLGFKSLLARALGGSGKKKREEKTVVQQTEKKKKTPAPKNSASSTVERVRIASVKDLKDFLDDADGLIVHPLAVAQAQLFADIPELALGTNTQSALITRTVLQDASVAKLLSEVLADATVKKTGHGLKIAWHWCSARGWHLNGIDFDTEIAGYLLAAGVSRYDLDELAASELGVMFADDARMRSHRRARPRS